MDGVRGTSDPRTHMSFSPSYFFARPLPRVPSPLLSLPSFWKLLLLGGGGRVGGPMRSLIGPCTHLTGVYWAPGPGPGAGGTAENRTDV